MRWKKWVRVLPEKFEQFSAMSILSFKLGAGMMLCFYIIAFASLASAPYAENYFNAIALFYGALEAAPASLAAGVAAGLIGDLMLKHGARG